VATLTYRRPGDLDAALPALVAQVEALPGAELLVVDNDTVPSAAEVVGRWSAEHPVRYVHEPRPGIAAARNRALDSTPDDALLVFIDDDERPSERWLATLVAAHERYGATGVVGPVVSAFEGTLDPWIVAGGWFTRLRHATGTRVRVVATNNLLLDLAAVRSLGVRFDEDFGLTGGSDTVFSLAVARRGGSFVWCDEAPVTDVVPASRATRRWVVRRAFRTGNSGARAAVRVAQGPAETAAARLRHGARGLARLAGGSLRWLVGWVTRDLTRRSRGTRTAVRGAGMVAGAAGYVYAEYARAARSRRP
jgi:hypothetical protein